VDFDVARLAQSDTVVHTESQLSESGKWLYMMRVQDEPLSILAFGTTLLAREVVPPKDSDSPQAKVE